MQSRATQASNFHISDKPEQRELSILQLIHAGSSYSRLDLARRTGLSPSGITAIVRGLLVKKLVTEAQPVSSLVGRRPIPLRIRDDAGYLLGVDIGSYYTRVVITDINGRIIRKDQIETRIPDGRVAVLQRVFKCVHGTMEASQIGRA